MDSLKKLEEISYINEGLFDKIFAKKEDEILVPKKGDIGYFLNGNYIRKIDGYFPYTKDLWDNRAPSLDWLLNSEYEAKKINVDKNSNVYFLGKWFDGEFKGKTFAWGDGGEFIGGQFKGERYEANNITYKADVADYFTGVFVDYENGILGTNLYKDENDDTTKVALFLIRVPDNWSVVIEGHDGKKITFQVLKKIDDKNTDFIFNLIPSNDKITIPWERIRRNYGDYAIIKIGHSFELFGGDNVINKVKSMSLIKNIGNYRMSAKSVVNFSLDERLKNFVAIQNTPVTFEVESSSDAGKAYVQNVMDDIKNGVFYEKLIEFKKFIDNNLVDGYISYIDLAPIFNGNVGQIYNANMKNEIIEIMSYFNYFMKYIATKSANVGIQEVITKSMKNFLFKDKKRPTEKNSTQFGKSTLKNKEALNKLKKSF